MSELLLQDASHHAVKTKQTNDRPTHRENVHTEKIAWLNIRVDLEIRVKSKNGTQGKKIVDNKNIQTHTNVHSHKHNENVPRPKATKGKNSAITTLNVKLSVFFLLLNHFSNVVVAFVSDCDVAAICHYLRLEFLFVDFPTQIFIPLYIFLVFSHTLAHTLSAPHRLFFTVFQNGCTCPTEILVVDFVLISIWRLGRNWRQNRNKNQLQQFTIPTEANAHKTFDCCYGASVIIRFDDDLCHLNWENLRFRQNNTSIQV